MRSAHKQFLTYETENEFGQITGSCEVEVHYIVDWITGEIDLEDALGEDGDDYFETFEGRIERRPQHYRRWALDDLIAWGQGPRGQRIRGELLASGIAP